MWSVGRWLVIAAAIGACAKKGGADAPAEREQAHQAAACDPASALKGDPGQRKIALLVGVGQYRNPSFGDLPSAGRDVDALYDVITAPRGGYGFPKQNVCVLRDGEATVAGVRKSFDALVARAKAGDSVLFYYSGHGAEVLDTNHDELDGADEALVLYDSLVGGVGVFRDDDLDGYLKVLTKAKVKDVVVLIDSATASAASRGTMQTKGVEVAGGATLPEPAEGDGGYWTAGELPGVVVLAAARSGASAFEPKAEGGLSYFTSALVRTLARVEEKPLTWNAVARDLPSQVELESNHEQFPVAEGDLGGVVFSASERSRPLGWEVVSTDGSVVSTDGSVVLQGAVPLPGWGVGAEVAVYDGEATREVFADPAAAKATLKVDTFDGLTARASLIGAAKSPLAAGDLAVLTLPGPATFRLEVAFDKAVPVAVKDAVQKAILSDPEAKPIVAVLDAAEFVVKTAADGALRLVDAEGITRNVFPAADQAKAIKDTLLKHARQRALMALRGVGNDGVLQDNVTIEVSIQKYKDQPECAREGWVQSCPNQLQRIPLCNRWMVMVRNTHPTETLRVYGVVLASDGEMISMPSDGKPLVLTPGQDWVELDPGQPPFKAVPPADVIEGVMVFGARSDLKIDQALLGTTPSHPIETVFATYSPGATRSVDTLKDVASVATVSHVPYRVVANMMGAPAPDGTCDLPVPKEYTIPHFDVTPYLPADHESALYKVLQTADALQKREIPYKQHDWSGASDEANLAKGIDCSRSIWWAFTRSGLPYIEKPKTNNYIATAEMFDKDIGSCNEWTPQKSPMYKSFDSCMDQPFQTGDVLVFQGVRPDTTECVGHTIMVVDPATFIGWGSHGWDGSKTEQGASANDTGVEYQVINAKTWGRWDRSAYALKACWRHKAFTAKPEENAPPEPESVFATPATGSFCDSCAE